MYILSTHEISFYDFKTNLLNVNNSHTALKMSQKINSSYF